MFIVCHVEQLLSAVRAGQSSCMCPIKKERKKKTSRESTLHSGVSVICKLEAAV